MDNFFILVKLTMLIDYVEIYMQLPYYCLKNTNLILKYY